LSRLQKLEYLETCFTPEAFRRPLRHDDAPGEWPADGSRGAVARARLMLGAVTGTPPRGQGGCRLGAGCLEAGQLTLASHLDNGSYTYLSKVLRRAIECRDLDQLDKRLTALEAQKEGN